MADRVLKPDSGNELKLQNNGGTSAIQINDDQSIDLTLGTSAGDDFAINSTHFVVEGDTGNVGVGTISPTTEISSNTVLEIHGGGGSGKASLALLGGPDSRWEIQADNGDDLRIARSSTYRFIIMANGNVGLSTDVPGQILDCNSGGGNMIADGYDTHSLAVYKENIEDASGYLDKVLACPAQKWNRIPFISADIIKEAVIEEFGKDTWDEHFPEDNSHRQKALYNMSDGDLKTWIDNWCEAKRVGMRPADKWQKKRLGLVADAKLTIEHLPEVISINDDGEPTGIDTMTYIGILHNAVQELSAKVTALENS